MTFVVVITILVLARAIVHVIIILSHLQVTHLHIVHVIKYQHGVVVVILTKVQNIVHVMVVIVLVTVPTVIVTPMQLVEEIL